MVLRTHNSVIEERSSRRRGFTLIELILVLALLTIVASLATPSLSQFFRGRALQSEARQLLSLTRAGHGRAGSERFAMLRGFDARGHTYGLQEEGKVLNGNGSDVDPKAEEFEFNASFQIETANGSLQTVNGQSLPAIRFLPDGTVDEN